MTGKRRETTVRLYESWVELYSEQLFAFAFRLTGNLAIAEDLVQETFYHAWKSLDSLKDKEKGRSWLYQILRNRYAHWRRDVPVQQRFAFPLESLNDSLFSPEPDTLDAFAQRESLQLALNALDDRYKEPFLMVFLQELTCRETADMLQLPLGTVLSRLHRARAYLRKYLKLLEDPPLRKPDSEVRVKTKRN